jgi:hypothetical protein
MLLILEDAFVFHVTHVIVARTLFVPEAQSALQQLSSKMALDCSTCHQLYSSSVLPSDSKLTP